MGISNRNRTTSPDATLSKTYTREHDFWRFRVFGAIIPDLDHVVAAEQ
jgi:hypothetical protein